MLDNTYGYKGWYNEKMVELEESIKSDLSKKPLQTLYKMFNEEGFDYKNNLDDLGRCLDDLTKAIIRRIIHD